MPRHRRKADSTDDVIYIVRIAIIVFVVLFGSSALAWWQSVPQWIQIALIVLMAITAFLGAGLILLLVKYHQRQRALTWQRAIVAWQNNSPITVVTSSTNTLQSARYLSPQYLETFAARTYKQMGYSVRHTGRMGDHGVDVHLTNPQGQIELVQCKQWNKPVGEPEIRDFYGAISHVGATRGWLWAPNGFSQRAYSWAKDKPIELLDEKHIHRLVESAYANKSAL